VRELLVDQTGIDRVLTGEDLSEFRLDHERSGELVLVSTPNSWLAYYWWFDNAQAPTFARRVDIHRKPGYDPVELYWDPEANGVPLDPGRVRGSHGAPAAESWQQGVLLASRNGVLTESNYADCDLAELVFRQCLGEV
jgi:hypothetical protein